MQLEDYIQQYSFSDIIAIEEQDEQFISIQKARFQIVKQSKDTQNNRELFVYLVVQCALVWFQIAWSWPKRRGEFSDKIVKDWGTLESLWSNNTDWRYQFLTTSTYNKRLYNIKRKRLEKFSSIVYPILTEIHWLSDYAYTMDKLWELLSSHMKQKPTNKTMSFAIKMYGYAIRIVKKEFIPYPANICIPLDSRLHVIYTKNNPGQSSSDQAIVNYYQNLAEKYNVAPLHLDSLLWIEYRKKYC